MVYTNKQECNFSKVEYVNKSIQSLWIHYLNHINGEEFKGLLKTFLLWFKIKPKHKAFHLFVGPWNVSVKIVTSEMAGSWGQWSTYSDSGQRNGTPLRLQPVCGEGHKGSTCLMERTSSPGSWVLAGVSYSLILSLVRAWWIMLNLVTFGILWDLPDIFGRVPKN